MVHRVKSPRVLFVWADALAGFIAGRPTEVRGYRSTRASQTS